MLKFLILASLKGRLSNTNFRNTKNKKSTKHLSTRGNVPGMERNTITALEEIYNTYPINIHQKDPKDI